MKKLFLLLSVFLFTSCVTTKTDVKPIQLHTQFPSPYDENGNAYVTLENDGYVRMPLWYWVQITEYVIDVESNLELRK